MPALRRLRRSPRPAADHALTPRLAAPVPEPGFEADDPHRLLLRVTSEALILQDRADAILTRIRRHDPLGDLARAGGALTARFFALDDHLPAAFADPEDEQARSLLSRILNHHAHLLAMAMELAAYEWRSERLRQQVEAIEGIGRPGELLETLYADLLAGRA